MTTEAKHTGQSTGPAIDRQGAPVIDPTENVKALQEASTQRQDDLRGAAEKFVLAEIAHIKEITLLHSSHGREMSNLRAEYTNRLAEAEAKRIDAIRAVDVNAVAVASERQAAAATVLANQVAQSADALRTLVSTTATANAEQQRQQMATVTDRLMALERSQYEGRGKAGVSDPMLAELTAETRRMSALMSSGSGKDEARKDYTGYIVAGIGLIFGLVGTVLAVVKFSGG